MSAAPPGPRDALYIYGKPRADGGLEAAIEVMASQGTSYFGHPVVQLADAELGGQRAKLFLPPEGSGELSMLVWDEKGIGFMVSARGVSSTDLLAFADNLTVAERTEDLVLEAKFFPAGWSFLQTDARN